MIGIQTASTVFESHKGDIQTSIIAMDDWNKAVLAECVKCLVNTLKAEEVTKESGEKSWVGQCTDEFCTAHAQLSKAWTLVQKWIFKMRTQILHVEPTKEEGDQLKTCIDCIVSTSSAYKKHMTQFPNVESFGQFGSQALIAFASDMADLEIKDVGKFMMKVLEIGDVKIDDWKNSVEHAALTFQAAIDGSLQEISKYIEATVHAHSRKHNNPSRES